MATEFCTNDFDEPREDGAKIAHKFAFDTSQFSHEAHMCFPDVLQTSCLGHGALYLQVPTFKCECSECYHKRTVWHEIPRVPRPMPRMVAPLPRTASHEIPLDFLLQVLQETKKK